AIADTVEENRAKAAEQYGVATYASGEELIDAGGLDAVFVVVPTYLHAPLAIRALNAGCHVFCEKPMALNTDLCQQMIDAADKSGKILMIGQVLRFWPEYIYLKNAIDSGKYGKLQSLTMQRIGDKSIGWERWYLDERRGGCQLFDRHVHDADAVQWMLGMPKAVYCYGVERDPYTDGGVFHSVTQYCYDSGILVSAEGSSDNHAGCPFTATYHAVFENGVISFNSTRKPTLTVHEGGEAIVPDLSANIEDLKSGMNITHSLPYFQEESYFFDCIRKGVKPTTVTPESAMETIRLVRTEGESVKQHKRIEL
ncbi:MAG: Gfo/Idh/MocA family oxidoreductase, partial [Victivallales bacterium]|nr:Gfo/Idh/MocA family oxidoreductase [Victivallales bacterium]